MKKHIIYPLLLVLIISSIFLYNIFKFKPVINLVDNLNIEYGDIIYTNDLVLDSNVTIVNEEILAYTLGEQEIDIRYLNNHNKEKKYKVKINVIDTVSPIILGSPTRVTNKGVDINLLNGIICADNETSTIECDIEGNYDINTVGSYNLMYVAIDNSNNKTTKDFVLKVVEPVTNNTSSTKDEITYTYFSDIVKDYKKDNVLIGIDVSRWQGNIDFEKVKNAGAEFVIIKLGYQDGFDGDYGLDSRYLDNIANATKAGLKIGLYLYSYAKNNDDAIKAANYIIDNIGDYKIDLPIAFDWENWNYYNSIDLNLYEFNNIAYTFMNELKVNGYDSMLYSSKNYLDYMWKPKEYNVWLAQYNNAVTYTGNYIMWQLTEKGKIDGIDHTVDIDILYK